MYHLGVVLARIPGKELTYLSVAGPQVAVGRLGHYVVKVVNQVGSFCLIGQVTVSNILLPQSHIQI